MVSPWFLIIYSKIVFSVFFFFLVGGSIGVFFPRLWSNVLTHGDSCGPLKTFGLIINTHINHVAKLVPLGLLHPNDLIVILTPLFFPLLP